MKKKLTILLALILGLMCILTGCGEEKIEPQTVKIAALAEHAGIALGPHFAMELHVHLGACYATEPWVEHFDWLEPLFNERLETKNGRMLVPTRPGLGLSLSEQARAWTRETAEIGQRA